MVRCGGAEERRSGDVLDILLAEDNPADVLLVREALEEHHIPHRLHVVQDGEQAIRFVERMGQADGTPCPDLFLLDLNLPKADGPQVLREFRRHPPECAHTPVVVVSSSDAPQDRVRVSPLGISHYFRKPPDLDAFLHLGAVVREVVAIR